MPRDKTWVHDADNPYETCSWCTNEVLDSTLRETPDGARICVECQALPRLVNQ